MVFKHVQYGISPLLKKHQGISHMHSNVIILKNNYVEQSALFKRLV